jgi:hydrogenase maturation protease
MKILVLGLGNLLMRDDAFGVHAARRLRERCAVSAGVEILDGGTLGLDLLPRLEGVGRLLILDAVEMGEPPGTLRRLAGEDIPRMLAGIVSVHQMGVRDLLAVAELQGNLPSEIVVWGVQPGRIEMGLEFTPAVEAALPKIEKAALAELAAWGVDMGAVV